MNKHAFTQKKYCYHILNLIKIIMKNDCEYQFDVFIHINALYINNKVK